MRFIHFLRRNLAYGLRLYHSNPGWRSQDAHKKEVASNSEWSIAACSQGWYKYGAGVK